MMMGGGSRVRVVGGGGALIDSESLRDDAVPLGEGGDEGFVLGCDEDRLDDAVVPSFSGGGNADIAYTLHPPPPPQE